MKSNSRFSYRQPKGKPKLIINYFLGSTLISMLSLITLLGSNLQFRRHLSQNLSKVIIADIPLPIYLEVMTDAEAVFTFMTANRVGLRNRLKELNIETKIFSLYRPYFPNEIELEKYFDQKFYNYTGYANHREYKISEDGNLIPITKAQNPKY